MYAIFEDGSRQYRVSVGDTVRIDHREAAVGSSLELSKVLLVANGADLLVGQPLVGGARVVAEVLGNAKEKSVIQYFRRRKNYRRLKGHTQPYVDVKIKHILKPGDAAPAA
ncbi:MAG TPA: 50S ribosomal protein L21 [Gemmataceae bacterium]|jgi:large subunit ribosomal protein L21|nr:50S ribosomal protein L21 [Gemmataceae bacterium]